MATADLNKAMEKIASHMRTIGGGNSKPYEEGREIWSTAMSVASESDEGWALWLLWGGLTDWVENKPDETAEAERAMVRAAQEWLHLSGDAGEREQYFDHWLYEEVGYERPAQ